MPGRFSMLMGVQFVMLGVLMLALGTAWYLRANRMEPAAAGERAREPRCRSAANAVGTPDNQTSRRRTAAGQPM